MSKSNEPIHTNGANGVAITPDQPATADQPATTDQELQESYGSIHEYGALVTQARKHGANSLATPPQPSHDRTSLPLSNRRSGHHDPLRRFPGVQTISIISLLFLYLPMLMVVVYSFNAGSQALLWKGFSFKWYAEVFSDGSILRATQVSLEVACAATILSTILGTLFILGADHLSQVGSAIGTSLINASLVIPEVVLGISTMALIRLIGIPQGIVPLILAHTTFCIPFVAMPIRARIQTLDHFCLEAAQDLGASRVQTVWRITLPMLTPAIISGALMAFVISMDDYLISNYLTTAGATTLPIYIFAMIRKGANPSINVVSTLLLLLAILVTVVSAALTSGRSHQGRHR